MTAMTSPGEPDLELADLDPLTTERCAAHPGRPAVDHCPVCSRPRCGADQLPFGGCTLCLVTPEDPIAVRRRPRQPELLVRGVLAAYATSIVWAEVTSEYVGADWFQYLAPGLLGILCGGAAVAAAGNPRRGILLARVRAAAVLCSLLGVGLGFLLENPFARPPLDLPTIAAYVIAGAAAWLWTAPPSGKRRKA